MPGPLDGVRVLDLSRVLAGPWCVQNLGDLGADVIKIERPGTGDESRQWGPPWLADADGKSTRESAYYLSANRNKRSVAIDMAKTEGHQLIRQLATRADVCIENFKVGDLARYGLDAAALCKLNPRLVYCSITGFGQDGPYAERPGYDYLFQGLGGVMSVTGERDDLPGGGPQRTGVPIVDLFTGMYALVSILAALHHRDKTGAGQHIDLSLLDVVLALSSGQISNYLVSGKVPKRLGNISPNIMPYEVFACADGQMIVASANQTQFVSLCRAVGHPEWATEERFSDNEARLRNRDELHARLEEVFRSRSGTEWEEVLFANGVPCGPINDYAQALAHPQAQYHGARIETSHALGVRAPGVASPMRFSATPVEYRLAPPLLGEHTREVLLEQLGLTHDELDRLEAGRIIACAVRPELIRRANRS